MAFSVGRAAERIERQAFPLSPGSTVKLESYRGRLIVEPGDGAEVRLMVRANSMLEKPEAAERALRALQLEAEQAGSTVIFRIRNPRESGIRFSIGDPEQLDIELQLTVPNPCNLDLTLNDGGIQVGRMRGNMKAVTRMGTIFFRGVDGTLDARSEAGDLVVSHCSGALKLRSISGSFRVGPVGGFADVYGYGGEIEVQAAGGGIKAETSGADLVVGFQHPVTSPATLRTGGANVIVTLDRRSACTLDLRASIFGKVTNVKDRLPLVATNGGLGKSRFAGMLNGGGPKIEARASGGHVYLQEAPVVE